MSSQFASTRRLTKRRPWRVHLIALLIAFIAIGPGQLAQAAPMTVAVFDNSSFVDTGGGIGDESDTVQATLTSLGHTVTTFAGYAPGDWTSAWASADLVLIPEMPNSGLNPSLSIAARTEIADHVAAGGGLLVMGDYGNHARDVMNGVFGFSIGSGTSASTSNLNAVDAAGTPFAGGPASLPTNNATRWFSTASLPTNTLSLYEATGYSSVFVSEYAAGQVGYLGWDWYNAQPIGSADNDWISVLDAMTMQLGVPPIPPNNPLHPDLIYNALSGEVVIDPDDAAGIIGYVLKNDSNSFLPANHTPVLGGVSMSLTSELAEASLSGITTPASIGNVLPTGMDLGDLTSLLTTNQVHTALGEPLISFDLIVIGDAPAVPEPSTYAMAGLALVGLGLVARRRKYRKALAWLAL